MKRTFFVLPLIGLLTACAGASPASKTPTELPHLRLTVDAAGVERHQLPAEANLIVGEGITAQQARNLPKQFDAMLMGEGNHPVPVQGEVVADPKSGIYPHRVVLRWIEPWLTP